MGWIVEESESGDIAADKIEELCIENDIDAIFLHSDNGSTMKCGTILARMEKLGVMPSFSRPRVSNDNPYSESLFKTLKYRPSYPEYFEFIAGAREWTGGFVNWSWDFDDSTFSSTQNSLHTYTERGYYSIRLQVTDSLVHTPGKTISRADLQDLCVKNTWKVTVKQP